MLWFKNIWRLNWMNITPNIKHLRSKYIHADDDDESLNCNQVQFFHLQPFYLHCFFFCFFVSLFETCINFWHFYTHHNQHAKYFVDVSTFNVWNKMWVCVCFVACLFVICLLLVYFSKLLMCVLHVVNVCHSFKTKQKCRS